MKKYFLSVLCVFCMLVGLIFPANTMAYGASYSEVYLSVGKDDSQLIVQVKGYNLVKVCSFSQELEYDSELIRFNRYEIEGEVGTAAISVSDEAGKTTFAFADLRGISLQYDTIVTLRYDILFDGEQTVLFNYRVTECINNLLEDLEPYYDSTYSTTIDNSFATYYTYFFEDNGIATASKIEEIGFGFSRNPGIVSGEFDITYDTAEMKLNSVDASKSCKKGMMLSYKEQSPGLVHVAFAFDKNFTGVYPFLDISIIPWASGRFVKFSLENISITTPDLRAVELGNIEKEMYVGTIAGDNLFQIKAPETVPTLDEFDVEIDVSNNSGIGAMTMDLMYDSKLFEYISFDSSNGIFGACNVSGKAGIAKIAAISGTGSNENGQVVVLRFRSIADTNAQSEFVGAIEELVSPSAKPLDFAIGKAQITTEKSETHTFGAPTFEWSSDGKKCIAAYKCIANDKHILKEECELTSHETPATCENVGRIVYTATSSYTGVEYTSTKTIEIDAIGHEWMKNPKYIWGEDKSTCEAVFTCGNDSTHTQTLECTVTKTETEADCNTSKKYIYKAVVEFEDEVYSDTKIESVGEPLGHSWDENPIFEWDSSYTSCAATFVCSRNSSHYKKLKCEVSSTSVPATCETAGYVEYLAEVEFEGMYKTNLKRLDTEAFTHDWLTPPQFIWSEDYKACTARFYCKNDRNHIFNVECEVNIDIEAPTCTEMGYEQYVARVEYNGEKYTDVKSFKINALGHKWAETPIFEWGDNYSTCMASISCENDPGHTVSEMCAVYLDVTYPDCETDGKKVYTAECYIHGKLYRATKTVKMPKTGHQWDSGRIKTKATVLKKGTKVYTCNNCGRTKTEDIPKLKATIKLSATKKTLKIKKSFVLKISKLKSPDSVASVKSSKKSVAKVKKKSKNQYKITAVKKGKATITVKLKSGKTAKCVVTVKKK